MFRTQLATLICLLSTVVTACAEPTPAQSNSLNERFARIEKADDRLGARDLMKYILEAAVAGDTQERIGKAIRTLREQQELREGNPTFGNFRWYRGQPEVKDRNAVQFVCQNAMALALGHPGRLNADNEAAFRTMIKDAAQGALNQKVLPSYTNIFLMKAANLVLLGQYLHQPELSDQGRAKLKEWFEYTKLNGVTEYNSTTYTGVDMDCAIQLVRMSNESRIRELGRAILQILWTEVAANWFEPAQRLGGSHSRDYNYLLGIGSLDAQLATNGWLPPAKPEVLSAEIASRDWKAPKEWSDPVRAIFPREVIQRWGQGLGQTATNWVTKSYCIGTCGASKAYDDKVFAMQFPGDRRTPMVYYVMDARNDPYGISKEPDSNGHSKTLHLRPTLGSVQNKDRVLIMAADDTERPKHLRPVPELRGLWSHWVFPSDATVHYADGSIAPAGRLPADKAVFIRKDGVVLGLRIVEARREWSKGTRLAVRLVRDGDANKAARITVEHGIGAHPGQGLVAFAAETALAPDDTSFAKFARQFSSQAGRFTLNTNMAEIQMGDNDHAMAVGLDLAKGKILKLEGSSPFPSDMIFSINGQDVWQPIVENALR